MKNRILTVIACVLGMALVVSLWHGPAPQKADAAAATDRLAVLWTSADPEVANRMTFMYALNAQKQGWFDKVRLVVWGPSADLLASNQKLQKKVSAMQEAGVRVQACVVCARSYGVADDLRKQGIEVKPMGKPLSDYLKGDWEVLSL